MPHWFCIALNNRSRTRNTKSNASQEEICSIKIMTFINQACHLIKKSCHKQPCCCFVQQRCHSWWTKHFWRSLIHSCWLQNAGRLPALGASWPAVGHSPSGTAGLKSSVFIHPPIPSGSWVRTSFFNRNTPSACFPKCRTWWISI